MNTNDKQLFWLKLIAFLMVGIIAFNMMNTLMSDQSGRSDSMAPITEDSATESRLISAIEELSSRMENYQPGFSVDSRADQGAEETAKVKIEPSVSNLEDLLKKLIKTLNRSALSSERNTVLREKLENISNWESIRLTSLWESHDAARKSLFMKTYSQVLELTGPPVNISGGGLCEVVL